MSIADKLQALIDVKEDMKSAIEEKGGRVISGLASYPAAIDSLPTSGKLYIDNTMGFMGSTWETAPECFDFSRVTEPVVGGIFGSCTNLVTGPVIDVTNFISLRYVFYYCTNLKACYFKGDPSKITDMENLFGGNKYKITVYYDHLYPTEWEKFKNKAIYKNWEGGVSLNFKPYDYINNVEV